MLFVASPVTQSVAAVVELLNCLSKCIDPLPAKVELSGGAQLPEAVKAMYILHITKRLHLSWLHVSS